MPRPAPSLNALRAQHDRARTRGARSGIRLKARRRAADLGVDCPAWAALRPKGPGDFNRPRKRKRTRPARPRPPATVDATQVEIPEAVREWRAQRTGRAIVVNAKGLTLIDVDGSKPLRFKSAAAAIAALA